MKIIFKIFKRDLKKIFTNPMAIILAVGVAILPSLYAWINIAANWDPYGADSTHNMQVAVMIDDEGASYKGIDINVGEKIKENLKTNNAIDWQFVSKDEGLTGVESNKYYAAIYVPQTFSKDLISIVTDKFTQPKITYYANEKKNAIATKITDKVVETVQKTVNKTYVETVVGLLSDVIGVATDKVKSGDLDATKDLNSQIASARDFIKSAKGTVNGFSKLVDASEKISKAFSTDEMSKLLKDSKTAINDTQKAVDFAKDSVKTVTDSVNVVIEDIDDTLTSVIEEVDRLIDKPTEDIVEELNTIEVVLSGVSSRLTIIADTLTDINNHLPIKLQLITDIVDKINNINTKIQNLTSFIDKVKTEAITKENLKEIKAQMTDIKNLVLDVAGLYKSEVQSAIQNSVNDTMSVISDVSNLITTIDKDLPEVKSFAETVSEIFSDSDNIIGALNNLLDNCDKQLGDFEKELTSLTDSEVFNTIANVTGTNSELGSFIACPVEIETDKIYAITNYGSAMAPFYSTLAIWVGAIILVAIFKTNVKKKKELGDVKLHHEFFGRGLTFIFFAVIQGTIVCLGDLLFLNIQCQNPVLFVLAGVFASIVYSLFIYSLVSAFGDIGKAVAVILLVIQLGASGGTFPIDVTPEFFRAVHPFAPFTFIINAMRECVCASYGANYWLDLLSLSAYIGVALVIGLVFKWLFKNPIKYFTKKIEETDIL